MLNKMLPMIFFNFIGYFTVRFFLNLGNISDKFKIYLVSEFLILNN